MTATQILSLTAPLLDSDRMAQGITNIMSEEPGNVIVLRADDGLYELAWSEVDPLIEALVRPWDDLLESVVRAVPEEDAEDLEQTPTPTPEDTDDS